MLQPAIELAEGGFPVGPVTAKLWQGGKGQLQQAGGPGVHTFLTREGNTPKYGELFRNPDLAATFRTLAEHGASEGRVAAQAYGAGRDQKGHYFAQSWGKCTCGKCCA